MICQRQAACPPDKTSADLASARPVKHEFTFLASSPACEYQVACHRYILLSFSPITPNPVRIGGGADAVFDDREPSRAYPAFRKIRHVSGFSCQLPGTSRSGRDSRASCPGGLSAPPISCPFAGVLCLPASSSLSRPAESMLPHDRRSLGRFSRRRSIFRAITNGIAMRRLTGNMKKYCVVTGT